MYDNSWKKILALVVMVLLVAISIPPSINGGHVQEDLDRPRLHQCLNKGILGGNIELTYDVDDIPSTIRPESDIAKVDLYINYFVSGIGSKFLVPFFQHRTVPIELSIEDTPEWCIISVSPGVVYPHPEIYKAETPEHSIVSISLMPNAPAFQTHSISVKAKASSVNGPFGIINIISSAENKIPIEIKSGYYSNFQYEYQTYAEMLPDEVKNVPINITSYSNARTRLTFEIIDPPEDWSVSIDSEIFIGTAALGDDPTGIATLTIQSPGENGYHNEVEQFNVRVSTMAVGHPAAGIDNTTILQFTVRCKGN